MKRSYKFKARIYTDDVGTTSTQKVRTCYRICVMQGVMELNITMNENGTDLRIHDGRSTRIAILPCAANSFIVRKLKK